MAHQYLKKIKLLQDKIASALKDSSFDKLAQHSTELESIVKTLANDASYKDSITSDELAHLRSLLQSVKKYQQETSQKFKNYTLEVSQKRKMHQAYKQYRG